MATFYKLVIKEIQRETEKAVSIAFHVPEELQANYAFIAGQYVTLKLTLDGQDIRRAYSICSAPKSGELRIAVKAVKFGLFSQFANSNLKVGDVLEVSLPEGKFTFEPKVDRQRNYAAFVAGSGITPVLSILKTVLENEPQSSFVLVYGNKSAAETIFHNQLQQLLNQYIGRFFVHYVFSQTNESELFGRIDKSVVNFVLYNKHKEKEFAKFYLCGPEEMITTVSDNLKTHAIPEKNIHFELFTTASEGGSAPNGMGHTQITLTVDDEETTFEMSQQQTILEAALKHGIDAPYSCQGGICSSCLARVKKGEATMKKNSILTDGEVAEGLILTCQAHPTTPEIVVDFDDI
ncbi:ferredoxin--NADP reductase [Flavobacterium sp.]|uniref:ferredoxin--NADP reductase n=1 Tax=Flavobacterium sp. TaxID=239 RepID=UPI0026027C56|nr:ferredoxin--NADP reductase [Flavobacterium sp.]